MGRASLRSVYQRRDKLVVISPKMATPEHLPIFGSLIIRGSPRCLLVQEILLYSQTSLILIIYSNTESLVCVTHCSGHLE